jgi:hypothetical protein
MMMMVWTLLLQLLLLKLPACDAGSACKGGATLQC